MKAALALPPFLPDQSVNSGALSEATNVYPRVDGYGPVRGLVSQSEALPAAFKGGASFIATDGTSYLLAGHAEGLSKYGGGTWADLVTGMTISGQWRFTQFGNYAIGVNGVETKVVDLNAGTASALTGAPAGVAITVVGDYVVIGQDSGDLLGIYTSAFNDHTGWTPGVDGATIQPMLTGGEVMGLAGGEYGVILQRQRLVRMTRTGDADAPFQFDEITPNVGCASKASVVAVGRTVFFLSDRGFMALEDGQAIKPIGSEKVDRTFQSLVPRDDYELLFSAVDPENKLVIWCVPGVPGRLWIYNFELDRWSMAILSIDGVFSGFTSSVTLEELAVTYTDLDAMTISLDDPRFSGGNPRLYGVDGAELCTFSGDTLEAVLAFSFQELAKGQIARLRSIRPVGDALTGQSITVDCRSRIGDPENKIAASDLRASGIMPIRCAGRYMKPRHVSAAGSAWTFMQGLEFDFEAAGDR